jgi:hypothetical protein
VARNAELRERDGERFPTTCPFKIPIYCNFPHVHTIPLVNGLGVLCV